MSAPVNQWILEKFMKRGPGVFESVAVNVEDLEGLLKQVADYQAALEEIGELQHHSVVSGHSSWQQIAREVLAKWPKQTNERKENEEK